MLDNVDHGLMKNRRLDLLDRMTKKKAGKEKKKKNIATLPGIFQQITPKKSVSELFGQTIGFQLVFICGDYFSNFEDPQIIQCSRFFYKKFRNVSCEYDRSND